MARWLLTIQPYNHLAIYSQSIYIESCILFFIGLRLRLDNLEPGYPGIRVILKKIQMRSACTIRRTKTTHRYHSVFYIPNFLTQHTLCVLFGSIGIDTHHLPVMEQIIDMPVHFFVSPQMPFYTFFQVILSAPYIDIKTSWEAKGTQTSNLYRMLFNKFNGKTIYTFG